MGNYRYNNQWYITIRIFHIATVNNGEFFENQTTNDGNLIIEATTFNKVIDNIRGNEDITIRSITNKTTQNTSFMTKSDTDSQEKITGIIIVVEFNSMFQSSIKV